MLQQFRQPEKRGFYSNGSRQTEDTWKGACFGLDRETAAALTGSQKFAACEQVLCGMGFEAGEQEILLQVPDAGFYRMAQIRWTTGRPPQSADEVAAGAETLEALGQGAACIGDRITLPGGRVLTLCGIAELPDRTGSLPLYLTREGMKALAPEKEEYAVYFRFREEQAEEEQMLRYAVSRMQSSLAGQGGRMMLSETYLKAQNTDLLVPAVCFAVVLLVLPTLHFLMVYSGFPRTFRTGLSENRRSLKRMSVSVPGLAAGCAAGILAVPEPGFLWPGLLTALFCAAILLLTGFFGGFCRRRFLSSCQRIR